MLRDGGIEGVTTDFTRDAVADGLKRSGPSRWLRKGWT